MKSFFLTGVFLGASLCALSGEPFLRNASFELGTEDWKLVRFAQKESSFRKGVPDRKYKIHGRQSLRIDNPDADTIELTSRLLSLRKGRTYTFSWYARSDRPLLLRGAMISQCDSRWYVETSHVTVTSAWQRFHCTFQVQEDSDYLPRFTWGNWGGKANSATLWIDAVQLEESAYPTSFQWRNREWEASATLNSRLSIEKEALTLTVKAVNYTSKDQEVPFHFVLEDTVFPEHSISLPETRLHLPANSVQKRILTIRPQRFGHMRLREKNGLCTTLPFAVIPRRETRQFPLRTTHHTGLEYDFSCRTHDQTNLLHSICLPGSSVKESLSFCRNAGISLLRVGNLGTAFSWKNMEKSPGVFDWEEIDRQIFLAEAQGFRLMVVFGNMLYLRDRGGKKRSWSRLPDFIIRNGELYRNPKQPRWDGVLPSHSDWKRYASAFAAHCKGRIAAYEITNEPNIVIPAEHYVEYVKLAAEEIRREDPEALVIGGCLTADYDGKLGHYLSLLKSSGALAQCDALSFHPYSSRLDTSKTTAASNIRFLREKSGGKTLWNSELYYLWDPPEAKDFSREVLLFSGMQPHHLFRRFTIDFGEGVMQSIPLSVRHILDSDGDRENWKGSPVFLTDEAIPNAMYAAYASASALYTGSRNGKKVKTPSGVTCYRFRHRDGSHFAVCWKKFPQETVHVYLPSVLRVLDIFGNEVPHRGSFSLSENPLILNLPDDSSFPIRFAPPTP